MALHGRGIVGCLQFFQCMCPAGDLAQHGFTLVSGQQRHTPGAGLELVERLFVFTRCFKHPARNLAVNFCACELFEQLGAVIGSGI